MSAMVQSLAVLEAQVKKLSEQNAVGLQKKKHIEQQAKKNEAECERTRSLLAAKIQELEARKKRKTTYEQLTEIESFFEDIPVRKERYEKMVLEIGCNLSSLLVWLLNGQEHVYKTTSRQRIYRVYRKLFCADEDSDEDFDEDISDHELQDLASSSSSSSSSSLASSSSSSSSSSSTGSSKRQRSGAAQAQAQAPAKRHKKIWIQTYADLCKNVELIASAANIQKLVHIELTFDLNPARGGGKWLVLKSAYKTYNNPATYAMVLRSAKLGVMPFAAWAKGSGSPCVRTIRVKDRAGAIAQIAKMEAACSQMHFDVKTVKRF